MPGWSDWRDYKPSEHTFTHHMREALREIAGWRPGQTPLRFYLRMGNGKRKKVRGTYRWFSHEPGKGFRISVDRVHWLGHYFHGLTLTFNTNKIEWTSKQAEDAFEQAMEAARSKMLRLQAGEVR